MRCNVYFYLSLYRFGEMARIIILFLRQEQNQKLYPPEIGGSNDKDILILTIVRWTGVLDEIQYVQSIKKSVSVHKSFFF